MQNLINKISNRTTEMNMAEKAGDMAQYDRLLKSRGDLVLKALQAGASPAYLTQLVGN